MHNFCSRLTMATNYLTLLPLRSVVHVLSPWIFVDTAFWPVEYEEEIVPDSEPKNSKTGHFHFVSWNTCSEGNNYCIRNLSSSRPLPSYNEAHTTMWKEKFSACSVFPLSLSRLWIHVWRSHAGIQSSDYFSPSHLVVTSWEPKWQMISWDWSVYRTVRDNKLLLKP